MYEYIIGYVTNITPSYIVVENGDIGYLIVVSNPYNFNISEKLKVYVYQHIKEDSNTLYGFKNIEGKNLFLKLLSVSGIGPKSALSMLATGSVSGIIQAIENRDATYLKKFPGIGAKASQQIILDLAGKLEFDATSKSTSDSDDVLEALKALGYKSTSISKIMPKINKELPIDEQIKSALKLLLK